MKKSLVSLDLETFLITPDAPRPKPVVAQAAKRLSDGSLKYNFATAFIEDSNRDELGHFVFSLLKSGYTICGANFAFDAGVIYEWYPELRKLLFQKYEDGQIFDVLIAQALMDLEEGHMLRDKFGDPYRLPGEKISERYSLELVTFIQTGRTDAKANDEYRLRYGELYDRPLSEYPKTALDYLYDDAKNTIEVAEKQIASGSHNLTDQIHVARRSLVLSLGQGTGLRTNPKTVEKLKETTTTRIQDEEEFFRALGIIREDGSRDTTLVKKEVARAYNCTKKCVPCRGAGRVESAKPRKKTKCRPCEGDTCEKCLGTRQIDSRAKVPPVRCETCDGTGVEIPEGLRTAAGGVVRDRDVLTQSDDPTLKRLGRYSWLEKIRDTYVPFLEQCSVYPANLRVGDLLENGRNSYQGLIQLIPRDGGVRECFEAPSGSVFCSIDFAAAEAVTLAQSCLWTVGHSKFADALNTGKDPHIMLASNMLRRTYEDLNAAKKTDKFVKNVRQGTKAGNYGFPGGMGFVKFAFAKRKENLFLCKLFGREDCGTSRVSSSDEFFEQYKGFENEVESEWNRHFPPICYHCLVSAYELKKAWENTWTEIPEYLAFVREVNEQRHGKMTQFVSERIRGGCDDRQAANTLFSGLAADLAREALWIIGKECEDKTSVLYGVKMLFFSHDETFTLLREDIAHEQAMRLTELQLAAQKRYTPDVQLTAEPALMYRWSKAAETKYENGRLVPYDSRS